VDLFLVRLFLTFAALFAAYYWLVGRYGSRGLVYWSLLGVGLIAVIALYNRAWRPKRKVHVKAVSQVVTTDDTITYEHGDGSVVTIKLTGLKWVGIETTELGPFMPDLFWHLVDDHGWHTIAGNADGCKRMLKLLQQLPEFDNETVIRAIGSTERAAYQCWLRHDGV
jgi:hypothetical protein